MLEASEGCALRKTEVRCQRLDASEGCALAREYFKYSRQDACAPSQESHIRRASSPSCTNLVCFDLEFAFSVTCNLSPLTSV